MTTVISNLPLDMRDVNIGGLDLETFVFSVTNNKIVYTTNTEFIMSVYGSGFYGTSYSINAIEVESQFTNKFISMSDLNLFVTAEQLSQYSSFNNELLYLGDDTFITGDSADFISSFSGNDEINSGKGNDTIDGGDGYDTYYLSLNKEAYSISAGNGGYYISDYAQQNGVKHLVNIEAVTFNNGTFALDSLIQSSPPPSTTPPSNPPINQPTPPQDPNSPLPADSPLHQRIEATPNGDIIGGNEGNDTIYGYGGNDTLNGNQDNDSVYGGNGDDIVRGGKQSDGVFGEDGNDFVAGDLDNDQVYGGTGNDTLRGGKDNDALFGESGNDIIYGDKGNDILWGGEGSDTFVFNSTSGQDIIKDYFLGTDRLQISQDIFTNAAQAVAAFNNSVLDLGNNNYVTLENVLSLSENDIIII